MCIGIVRGKMTTAAHYCAGFALRLDFILLRAVRMGKLLGNEADRIGRLFTGNLAQ